MVLGRRMNNLIDVKLVYVTGSSYDIDDCLSTIKTDETDWEQVSYEDYNNIRSYIMKHNNCTKNTERILLIRKPTQVDIPLRQMASEWLKTQQELEKRKKEELSKEEKKKEEARRKRELKKLEVLKKKYE
jgi:hypothetical protein